MQDRPAAPELLDAVAEYLFGELRPEVPREQRFKILVAANLCAVVAREIRSGEGPAGEDAELFRSILGEAKPASMDDPEAEARRLAGNVVERLRSGEFDEHLGELSERLAEHVRRKLDIARPGYDTES